MNRKLHAFMFAGAITMLLASGGVAENGADITQDVVYGHKDGMALTFDVFRPTGDANGAGLLFMVSGGWFSRYTAPERAIRRFQNLIERGYTVFAVRHGSAPRFKVPEAVADVRRAVRYIRLNADELHVDAERLGVFGGSAGGHLSLMLGLASDDGDSSARDDIEKTGDRVAAVVAYFPPTDLRDIVGPSERFPALDFDSEESAAVSPILHVSADDPPTLLIHGDADELVNISHSQKIMVEFGKSNVKSELVVIEGAGHGFRGENSERAGKLMADWFDAHLAAK